MKKMRIVSGLLAAALLLGAPGAVQTAKAVSVDEAVSAATTSSYEVKVTANSLTIRAKANKSSTIKGYLQKNDVVTIVDESVDSRGYTWGKLASGKGWISLRYTNWSGANDDASSSVNYKVKVTAGSLTIRAKANKSSAVKGYLQKDAVVTIVEEQDDSRGYTWGKLSTGKGWISLRYTSSVDADGSVSTDYDVKVTASSLNVRAKATSSSAVVDVLKKGEVVTIAAEKDDANGNTWGKLDDGTGWIFLQYTSVTDSSGSFDEYDVKVTAASLYIREKANQNSEAVGFLRKGNIMTIVAEAEDSSGNAWGKLENGDGWISLKYTTKVSSTPDFAQYKVKVTVNSLRIRASASASSAITGGLVKGNVVTIVAEKNGWGKLSTGAGWIYLDYTKTV